jgi:hypothetical protein
LFSFSCGSVGVDDVGDDVGVVDDDVVVDFVLVNVPVDDEDADLFGGVVVVLCGAGRGGVGVGNGPGDRSGADGLLSVLAGDVGLRPAGDAPDD